VSTTSEETGLGFRFFVWLSLSVLGIGIVGFLGFLIFSRAVYAWGFLGALFAFGVVLVFFGWLYDKRHERPEPY
jgi:hypothetical protein